MSDDQYERAVQKLTETIQKASVDIKNWEKQRDNLSSVEPALRPPGAPNIDRPEVSNKKIELTKQIDNGTNALLLQVIEIVGTLKGQDRDNAANQAIAVFKLEGIAMPSDKKNALEEPDKSARDEKELSSHFYKNEIKTSYGSAFPESKFISRDKQPPSKNRDQDKEK